ncbi:unnamed protein product [Lasius platythorax]|uniref:Uncharacterized protein n=1 Tax=Lasius platythorax TaxID=488582 RepID=A0AAV2NVD7_9HYME
MLQSASVFRNAPRLLPHFQFPSLRKNEAHVWRHDAYDLRAIAAGAIYTLLTGNPVQEAAVRHDCSPSDGATAAAPFHCNTTDDGDPEVVRVTRIFRVAR